MDFPSAFEFIATEHPDKETHHPKCSYRQAGMLCDCSIIWCEYYRRENAKIKTEFYANIKKWLSIIGSGLTEFQEEALTEIDGVLRANKRMGQALETVISVLEEVPSIGYKRGQWWSARCEGIDVARAALAPQPNAGKEPTA